jgi:hypothetical protein
MKIYLLRAVILLVTFVVSFFITTAIFDTFERQMGYYDEGLKERVTVTEQYLCIDCTNDRLCSSLDREACQ